jgi:hypothetical protein
MAFIYHLHFDIGMDRARELEVGSSLERSLGYLRSLLPGEVGFVTSRAGYSVNLEDRINIFFESVWETWDDVEAHRRSSLLEEAVLGEFTEGIMPDSVKTRLYREVD